MDKTPLLLKKYTNRRLYDTEKSIYVTLDYVTDTIRQGRHIQVTDAKTGEDVTPAILTQIVLEEARKKKISPSFPPPLSDYPVWRKCVDGFFREVSRANHS